MSGQDATFFVQGRTLDRMHHMAHFALGAGHDIFDHMHLICGCLMAVCHQDDLQDADRVLLCRVAELLQIVLSRSHLDLFLPLEYTICCHVPARHVRQRLQVLRDEVCATKVCADLMREKYRAAAAILRAYCKHLPRYLLLREHNWLERSTDLLSDAAQRLRDVCA